MEKCYTRGMETERFESYSNFINDPKIDVAKILDELHGTPFLQDYDQGGWSRLALAVKNANLRIPFVNEAFIKNVRKNAEAEGLNKTDALFRAIQACLIPAFSEIISKALDVDSDDLMLAATHIGVVEISELFQRATTDTEKQKLQIFALYFANAQAKILGFKTSTTLLAMDLADKAEFRFDNIAIVSTFENEEKLEKARIKAIFEGCKVVQKDKGKYFIE